jgi:hypothetical protein
VADRFKVRPIERKTNKSKSLRVLSKPFIVAPPAGVSIQTRLTVTKEESEILKELSSLLGSLHRKDLSERTKLGVIHAEVKKETLNKRKREMTSLTSSRWAGSITRSVEAQYEFSMRNLIAEKEMLEQQVELIAKKLKVRIGESKLVFPSSYKSEKERYQKTRRLNGLKDRLDKVNEKLENRNPSITLGGAALLRKRSNLEEAGLNKEAWRNEWDSNRLFLNANGSSDELYGNQTIRVTPDGIVTIKTPKTLVEKYGSI